jgi:hypothetical protein
MVKIVQDKEARIKLQRGNKVIDRSLKDYQANKSVYDFRGFKPVQDVVKETKVEQPKKRKTRKKKDEQVDLETSEKMD